MMSKRLQLTLAASIACAAATTALAVDPQPPRGPQTASGRAPTQPQPTKQSDSPAAHDTATQFQRNGGSLLRTSMAEAAAEAANNPKQVHEVSYFAIPEP